MNIKLISLESILEHFAQILATLYSKNKINEEILL